MRDARSGPRSDSDVLHASFAAIVGDAQVTRDAQIRDLFSHDVFYRPDTIA